MKKLVVVASILALCTGVGQAVTINWNSTFDASDGLRDSTGASMDLTWTIVLYHSSASNLPTQIYFGGTSDNGATATVATTTGDVFDILGPGSHTYFSDNTYDDAAIGLTSGDHIFTVVFNSTTIGTATQYAIVDDSIFTLNYNLPAPPSVPYDCGGTVAGDWNNLVAVPEPGTMGLMLVGGAMLAARTRRKKKRSVIQA